MVIFTYSPERISAMNIHIVNCYNNKTEVIALDTRNASGCRAVTRTEQNTLKASKKYAHEKSNFGHRTRKKHTHSAFTIELHGSRVNIYFKIPKHSTYTQRTLISASRVVYARCNLKIIIHLQAVRFQSHLTFRLERTGWKFSRFWYELNVTWRYRNILTIQHIRIGRTNLLLSLSLA